MGSRLSGNRTVRKLTMAKRKKAIAMVNAGKSVIEVAKKYGVSRQYIYSLMGVKRYKTRPVYPT